MESETGFCTDMDGWGWGGGGSFLLTQVTAGGSRNRLKELGCIVQSLQSNLAGDLMTRRDLSG